jgi:hypothetical protein
MNSNKPWQSKEIKSTELSHLGFKEINKLDASRKFPQNINILIKFFYHDAFNKTLIESPLFLLDKTILKNLEKVNKDIEQVKNEFFVNPKYKRITTYTAFDFLFTKLQMQEIFPHSIMSTFIYSDNRTKIPKQFIKEKIIPLNENQSYLIF